MRVKYSVVIIVFNPNSTGDSRARSNELLMSLKKAAPSLKVRLRPSKYPGHAETIAFRNAMVSRHALIVSVSGDGGYNDVINGALRAQALKRTVSVGLIPAGNANDHYATVHRGNFITRVLQADEDRIDALRLTSRSRGRRVRRYGHSYIGVGITPQASERLNATKLNLWQEIKILAQVLTHPKSAKILVDGELRRYDSLVFSNVKRMSKVIRIPGYQSNDDGKFEVSSLYFHNKLRLVPALIRAAVSGLPTDARMRSFSFDTLRNLTVQVDGETFPLDAGVEVKIDVASRALHCIV